MTQVIPIRADLDLGAPADDVRDAIVAAVCMTRTRLIEKARLLTRFEDGGPLPTRDGPLTHVIAELLLDAVNAFPGPLADNQIVVLTCQQVTGYAVIRVADNAPGLPRHALCLAGVIERLGGDLRVETTPGGCNVVTVVVPIGRTDGS